MDLPPDWVRAEARRLEPDDEPRICRHCPRLGECDRDPHDCEADAEADAIDRAYEADRDRRICEADA